VEEERQALAAWVAARLAEHPVVEAVALGGSAAGGWPDARSDVDLYVYADPAPPLDVRVVIAAERSARAEIGNDAFEPGDEWVDAETGICVDVMYRSPAWVEGRLDAVLVEHRASVGYSTCSWSNVRGSAPLFDRSGWFGQLQGRARASYPEELRRDVVRRNHPLLRTALSSFLHQIELALRRDDRVAIQHRTTALLASYFDVLFAVNRVPHPGEKRLLRLAEELCPRRPVGMADDVRAVLDGSGGVDVVPSIHRLLDRLDELLRAERLLPAYLAEE
jgi:predicted nucleotidyltransferase